jgi:hypothetical protein
MMQKITKYYSNLFTKTTPVTPMVYLNNGISQMNFTTHIFSLFDADILSVSKICHILKFVDINIVDVNGETLLFRLCRKDTELEKRLHLIEMLIKKGIDITINNNIGNNVIYTCIVSNTKSVYIELLIYALDISEISHMKYLCKMIVHTLNSKNYIRFLNILCRLSEMGAYISDADLLKLQDKTHHMLAYYNPITMTEVTLR